MTATGPGRQPPLLTKLLDQLGGTGLDRSVLAVRSSPPSLGDLRPVPSDLDVRLALALAESKGIRRLYSHQVLAFEATSRGQDVVVVTPTASGKSLCFNLPVLDRALKYPPSRSLYLYPTKALANDQLAALEELVGHLHPAPTAAVFHGDLSQTERNAIRSDPPNILLATPDILHYQQLPKHAEWAGWWRSLHFVVLDEAHAYRGVFGSHIAHLMRRVRRVAESHGARPAFIATTATIGNPVEHVANLIGSTPLLIDADGAPQRGRDIVIWDPLVLDGRGIAKAHASSEVETARLAEAALRAGLTTITFARSRRMVEKLGRRVARDMQRAGDARLAGSVATYRSGYTKERREEIESGLRDGTVKAVFATNALELGIDIGSLDVAILSSYPGSTMSFRQQAGRAGRRESPALVIQIASQNPLDRYVAEHPDLLTESSPECATTDLTNETIARGQLGCAARELALGGPDAARYGPSFRGFVMSMADEGLLERAGDEWRPTQRTARPSDVSLRSTDGKPFTLFSGGRMIGELEARLVAREAHLGAIYLHDGHAYRVRLVDEPSRSVMLELSRDSVITEPVGERYVDLLKSFDERQILHGQFLATLGRIKSTTRITGYREIDESTGRQRGEVVDIDPVRSDLRTVGIRLEPYAGVDGRALHGLEHLIGALAPLRILCDRADLDGHTVLDAVPRAAFVFDRHVGGVGLSERLYGVLDEVIQAAGEKVAACPCADGCPACIHSSSCFLENDMLDKAALIGLLG